MEYIIVGFVILLIWGNISRRKNPVRGIKTFNVPTAGDNFNSGCAIVSGVCEPPKTGTVAPIPIHVFIPVDPPPIAIQKKTTIYPEGTLIGFGTGVYAIQNGKSRLIPDPYTFTAMGFNWSNVQNISAADFNSIQKGPAFPRILPKVALPKVNPTNPVLVTPTPRPVINAPHTPGREVPFSMPGAYSFCAYSGGGSSCGMVGGGGKEFYL